MAKKTTGHIIARENLYLSHQGGRVIPESDLPGIHEQGQEFHGILLAHRGQVVDGAVVEKHGLEKYHDDDAEEVTPTPGHTATQRNLAGVPGPGDALSARSNFEARIARLEERLDRIEGGADEGADREGGGGKRDRLSAGDKARRGPDEDKSVP